MQSYPSLLVSHLKETSHSRSTRSSSNDIIIRDREGGYHMINKVLAAAKSKYFLKMFEWSPEETEFVVDLDGKPLGSALSWVLTEHMDFKRECEMIKLLEVAEFLLMDDLSSICQQVLIFCIRRANILIFLPLFLAVAGCSA